MFSVILYMLRLLAITLPPCSFHLFSALTVTFPKLSVILRHCTSVPACTTSSVHNTRHRNWGVSMVLCSTHRGNCRLRFLSSAATTCTVCAWNTTISRTVRHAGLWESRSVAEEIWRLLVDGLSDTISSLSVTLCLPWAASNASWECLFLSDYDASFKYTSTKLFSIRISMLTSPEYSEGISVGKKHTNCISAHSALVNTSIFYCCRYCYRYYCQSLITALQLSTQITSWSPQGMRVLRQFTVTGAEVMFVTIQRENIRPSNK
jgi:hypothetical protein